MTAVKPGAAVLLTGAGGAAAVSFMKAVADWGRFAGFGLVEPLEVIRES